MAKYGRGLNREIVAAVNTGELTEPITVESVRRLVRIRDWPESPTENQITVTLSNGASDAHSATYKKYFYSLDHGEYELRPQFRGERWR